MPTPPLGEVKAEAIRRLKAKGLSNEKIADELQVSTGTVSKCVRAKPHIESDKKFDEFAWRDWSKWIKDGQKLKKKASRSQEQAAIKLGDGTRPEIICQLGDLHIGAWGTDYDLLEKITDELKETGVWVALMGDLLEMAIKLRSVLEVCSQVLPPEQQVQFLESWIEEILPQVVFSVWCNHGVEREEKMSGVSLIKGILSKKTVYFNGIGHPDVQVGNQVYKIAASHKFRGSSMYDSTFGAKRYSRMEAHDREIIMQGDLHRYGISQYSEGGIEKVAITSGTLHLNSGYAKRYFSLKTLPIFPCLVLHHDQHKITPFINLGDALRYRDAVQP